MVEPTAVMNKFKVCSTHFEDSCFTSNAKNRLKHDAVPTENINGFVSESIIYEYTKNLQKWQGKYCSQKR